MTAATTPQNKTFVGDYPRSGSPAQAADTLILRHTLVSVDSSGRANPYAESTDGSASLNVLGIAKATFDNRTTAPEGGGAGAIRTEVEFGVWEFAYSGTAPDPGEVLWALDNQTVTLTSTCTTGGGTRGLAGYCVSTDTVRGTCRVLLGPTVVGQIVIAASEASQLDTAQADILELQTDAESAACEKEIPLGSGRLATGAAIAAFTDGSVDGFQLADSEGFGIRFNPSVLTALAFSVDIPADADDAEAIVLHAKGCRIGAADTTTVLAVGAFAHETGDAHTADADAGGNTSAFDGATTVITDETLSFAAGVLPAGSTVSLTVAPSAALDADDLLLLGLRLVYTRKMRAA